MVDEGFQPEQLAELLAEHNLTLSEIEVLRGWANEAAGTAEYEAMEATTWEMADRFGCRYLQAIGPYTGTIDDCARKYGELCDRAGDHGLVVGLEFLPFTNIYDANDGMRVVDGAGRDNGGLCVDIWHHTRGSNDLAQIQAIPGDRVMAIQMNDGPATQQIEDYVQDCLRTRVPTGKGTFDVDGFVGALIDGGANVPVVHGGLQRRRVGPASDRTLHRNRNRHAGHARSGTYDQIMSRPPGKSRRVTPKKPKPVHGDTRERKHGDHFHTETLV